MLTLGAEAAVWAESFLAWPGGEPLRLTEDQARFLLRFYEVDATGSRYKRTRAFYGRPKGAGKSPLGAILSAIEAWGPAIPAGIDAYGLPVGRPRESPEVLIFATEESQAGNVYSPLCDLLVNGEALAEFGLDVGLSRIVDERGGAVYPMSAAAQSKDGRRSDFVVLDESHLMFKPALRELASIIRRNLAKRGGRSLEVSTAWRPGQRSVAELTWEYSIAIAEGRIPDSGLLFDMRSGPVPADWANDDELRGCLAVAYEGCGAWIDLERLVAEARDPSVARSDVERYFLNRIVASEDAYIPFDAWQRCGGGAVPPAGSSITLGFDGSWTDDATALVGVSMDSGTAFLVGLWEAPPTGSPEADGWEVDQREVDATIELAFTEYEVERFYADPFRWQDWLASWQDRYGERVRAWYTHRDRQMADALVRLHDGVMAGLLTHADEEPLSRHVANATRRIGRNGSYSIGKPPGRPSAKIDAAMALVLAWEARADAIAKGWNRQRLARERPRPTLVSF